MSGKAPECPERAPAGSGLQVSAEPITVRIRTAVAMTGISRSRLYELIASGDVEIVKIGASTLVLVESLRALVESRRCAPVQAPGGRS